MRWRAFEHPMSSDAPVLPGSPTFVRRPPHLPRSMTTAERLPSSFAPPPGAIDFDAATDQLYRSFAEVPFRPDMWRCAHCVTAAEVAALGVDVADIPPALVARFLTKAGTTWGGADDVRRIAPRALHLAAEQRLPVNRSVVLTKLSSADWATWPVHQVDAVCRFLLAEWDRLLLTPPRPGHAAHRWLRQTAATIADLEPFLASWQREMGARPGPPAVHLAVLLVNSELRPDFPATINDLFAPPSTSRTTPLASGTDAGIGQAALAEQFGAWLASPVTEANLAQASTALRHTAHSRRLTLAVDRLRRYRTARTRAA